MLDSTDARALAEFYRQLLGFVYRPGDEPSADGRGLTIDTKSADRLRTSGSPLCQDTAERRVLCWVSAGLGSDFSEELAWG
ncbi:VOC family protein [Micromonospora maris]|uniref:VOC family protein n=1 Tax=Micromonospora maris TaxID=1003110 RepID=UPI001E535B27|nr:VOC family protein [Micromonospora maris]